jgi:type I restriction enzyme, S subunit
MRPLGELFEIGAGKTMSAAAREGSAKTPFLRTSNVLWDEIDLTTVDEMAIPADELENKLLQTGDLLVCEGGEIGRAAIWNGDIERMSFQNHVHRLRPLADDVEPRFYVYFLQCGFTQLGIFEGVGNKTTIPNLSRNRLAALQVPYPDLTEQRDIASALVCVRRAMRLHGQSLMLAEDLKQSVMQAVFATGLRGEPSHETQVGLTPVSWRQCPLKEHFQVASGGTPNRGVAAYWANGTIPWVKTGEINYCVITRTEECITPEGLAGSSVKLFPAGTLLMAMFGQGVTRGRVGFLGIEATCNQACAAIQPADEAIDVRFLYHFLTWRYEAIRSLAHGGQQQNLNLEIVRNMAITFPESRDEQHEIVASLDAIDRKIDLHRRKTAILNELFKSLLHKLMTGQIRAADLDVSAIADGSLAETVS